jgi:hypothetical protein
MDQSMRTTRQAAGADTWGAERFVTIVLWVAAAFFLLPGIWAFVAPHSFFEQLAPWEPYNRHFIHDIGAFQIGIGIALLAAARFSDARFVALAGAAAGATVHAVSHLIDHDHGGKSSDIPLFASVALVLVIAAVAHWRMMELRQRPGQPAASADRREGSDAYPDSPPL